MAEIYSVKSFNQYQEQQEQYQIAKNSSLVNFNVGSRLKTITESISNILAIDSSDFFLALKKAIPVAIYSGFDFPAQGGDAAAGSIEFYKLEPATVARNVNAGTRVQLGEFVYETIEAGQIDIGETTTGDLAARATSIGEAGNIGVLDIDTRNGKGTILNTPPGIEFARNNNVFAGGTDSETEEERKGRFKTFINGLAKSNLNGIITALNGIPGLISFFVRDIFPEPGTVTVFAEDAPGTLTPETQALIEKTLLGDINDLENFPGYLAFGLSLLVLPPTVVPIDLEFDIIVKDTSPLAEDAGLAASFLASLRDDMLTFTNTKQIGSDVIISEYVTLAQNFDTEVHDMGLVTPPTLDDNIVIAEAEVPRSGPPTIGDIVLNLVVTSDY